MDAVKRLREMGYTVEEWSSWDGDKGKFKFCKGTGHWLGELDTNQKKIRPCHGFYGSYLIPVARELSYELEQ